MGDQDLPITFRACPDSNRGNVQGRADLGRNRSRYAFQDHAEGACLLRCGGIVKQAFFITLDFRVSPSRYLLTVSTGMTGKS